MRDLLKHASQRALGHVALAVANGITHVWPIHRIVLTLSCESYSST
jgi:hypothetical protein